jgi:hypothetical protein
MESTQGLVIQKAYPTSELMQKSQKVMEGLNAVAFRGMNEVQNEIRMLNEKLASELGVMKEMLKFSNIQEHIEI